MLLTLLLLATLGSGLMAGLFCSFSNFGMKALAELPPAHGAAAMQSINRVIQNPLFLAVFMGTAVVGGVAVGLGWSTMGETSRQWALAATIVHFVGSVLVTITRNVPLNNRLDGVDPETVEGQEMWQTYLARWTPWNHLRSLATVASTILYGLALASLQQ